MMGTPEGLQELADKQYMMFCYVCGEPMLDRDEVILNVPALPPQSGTVQASVCKCCVENCPGVREEAIAQKAIEPQPNENQHGEAKKEAITVD